MANVTLMKVGVSQTLAEFVKSIYDGVVAGDSGIAYKDQPYDNVLGTDATAYTLSISIKMTDGSIVAGYNVYDFIANLIDAVEGGKTCDYTDLEWARAIPEVYGYVIVDFDRTA